MYSSHGSISNSHAPVVFITLIFMLSGCADRMIDPYEGERSIYSIYGALEVGKTPNYIRVKDLQVPFDQENPPDLDATVRFENLDSGTVTALEDTVVHFSINPAHNFIVIEPIQPLGRYRITAERPDGAIVQTMAMGPHVTEVEAEPTENVDCEKQIEFTFKNVPAPEQVVMEVGFFHEDKMQWNKVRIVDQLKRIEGTDQLFISMSPRNLLVEVFTPRLDDDDGRPIPPRLLLPTVKCHELQSDVAHIRYNHFGPEWEAVVPIYPVNPDDVMDVENGLGFVGVYKQESFSFTIDQTVPE